MEEAIVKKEKKIVRNYFQEKLLGIVRMFHSRKLNHNKKMHERTLRIVYEMVCAILYHLHNLKNMKNTHGGVLR